MALTALWGGLQGHNALAHNRQAESEKLPEIVWAPGKTAAQVTTVMRQAAAGLRGVLAVRLEPDVAAAVMRDLPEATYSQAAHTLRSALSVHCEPSVPIALVTSFQSSSSGHILGGLPVCAGAAASTVPTAGRVVDSSVLSCGLLSMFLDTTGLSFPTISENLTYAWFSTLQ